MLQATWDLSVPARSALFAAALFVPGAALSNEVSLTSLDGAVNLSGGYVGFEDGNYIINTDVGELRVAASRVQCVGAACPDLSGTSPSGAPDASTHRAAEIKIVGSDEMGLGMMPLLLEGYAGFLDAKASLTARTGEGDIQADLIADRGFGPRIASYQISSSASVDAFATLLDRTSELGMSTRRIAPDEAQALRSAGAGNMIDPEQEHIVAVDSLVVITHPDNPVSKLTVAQLADIYAGRTTNWAELGGQDAPIIVYDRPKGDSAHHVFSDAIFSEQDARPDAPLRIGVDDAAVADAVLADTGAIGYVAFAHQKGTQAVRLVNACGLAMSPDAFSARTEEYLLQRRLYLYSRSDSAAPARDFLQFVKSPIADAHIAKSGFITLSVDRKPQMLHEERARILLNSDGSAYEARVMREMLNEMIEFDRLSTTFRFRSGSSRMDTRAEIDLTRLGAYLEEQPEGTHVRLAGFSDDIGAFDSNRDLSLRRANRLKRQMTERFGDALAHIEFSTAGYGEIAPVACNTDEDGRRINRRVEVWIQSPKT